MKLLITGATGGIGKNFIYRAQKNNFKINFLTTKKNKLKLIANAKGYFWNPKKNKIDINCFKDVDTIIHLSGAKVSKRWTKKNKEEIYKSRILSTDLLYNSIKGLNYGHNIRSFICASAIGIYKSDYNKIYDEKNKICPSSFLERVVYDWEKSSLKIKKLGIRLVNLRIGLVFYNGGILKAIRTAANFGLICAFGSGKQGQSWIHIDDLIEIFYLSIKNNWEGIYNAVSPNPVNQIKMMELISKNLNKLYFMPNIPEFMTRIMLGEMSHIIISSHWVSCEKIIKKGFIFKFADLNSALKDFLRK